MVITSRMQGLAITGRPATALRRLWALGGLCGMVAAVAYSSFILEYALGSPLDPVNSYVSELEASGQPASGFFRTTDVVAGTLIVVLAATLWTYLQRSLPPTRRIVVGCVALAIFGIACVMDALAPIRCTPSTDLRCRSQEMTSLLAQLREPHTISSAVGISAAVIGILAVGSLLSRSAVGNALGRVTMTAGAVGTAMAVVILPLIMVWRWVGLVERIQVVAISAGIASLAVLLLRASRASYNSYERHGPCPAQKTLLADAYSLTPIH
jgi:Protein of unknown function (DUF998)